MPTPRPLVPIPGTELFPRDGTRVIGRIDPDQRIELTVRLRPRPSGPGAEGLEQLAVDLGGQKPGARRYLTPEEFEGRFGADPADLAKVEAFAQGRGFAVIESSLARRTVELAGPIGPLSAAFGVTLNLSSLDNATFRERTGPISVPADLAGIVVGVFGFDTRRMAEPQRRAQASRGPAPIQSSGGFSPVDVATLYNFPAGLDGTGQCIGILEFGGGFRESELATYFGSLGLQAPKVVAVPVGAGKNHPGADPGADGEVMLDIEVAGAVAPGATIAVYFSSFTLKGWVDALTKAIHDPTHKPSVLSISWGFAEDQPLDGRTRASTLWTLSAVAAVNQALAAAATLGVTVICAAGDDGSADQFRDGLDHVDFPASSPYMLACGGTKLVTDGSTIASEVVWNELAQGEGATGGGISALIPRPDYQSGTSIPPSKNPGHFVGRGVPDVAGNADPVTGYRTLADGQQAISGGTSAVAPLWAGLIARINQGLAARVGFFNPLLYKTIGPAKVLKDITTGDNGDFQAGPGWDACTGWGSPDGQALLDALRA